MKSAGFFQFRIVKCKNGGWKEELERFRIGASRLICVVRLWPKNWRSASLSFPFKAKTWTTPVICHFLPLAAFYSPCPVTFVILLHYSCRSLPNNKDCPSQHCTRNVPLSFSVCNRARGCCLNAARFSVQNLASKIQLQILVTFWNNYAGLKEWRVLFEFAIGLGYISLRKCKLFINPRYTLSTHVWKSL